MAAPQIGRSIQLAVIEDMDHSQMTPQQLEEKRREKVPFLVIINPRLEVIGAEKAEFFEGCLSVPELLGVVPRALSVRVECMNERAEPIVIKASGWYARILQHEIDHLNGVLFLDKVQSRTLTTTENYVKMSSQREFLSLYSQAAMMRVMNKVVCICTTTTRQTTTTGARR